MAKQYIVFSTEQLQSMKPSKRTAEFIIRFCRLTQKGPARIGFSRQDLNKWLFVFIAAKAPIVVRTIGEFNRAKKTYKEE